MFSNKDYANMTLEELESEKAKSKSQNILTAFVVGLLVGIAVYSATNKGGFILTVGLLLVALGIGSKHSQNQKKMEAEISRRR